VEVTDVGYNFGVGREAPQFDLTAHDGSRVTLKQYRGDWFAVVCFLGADTAAAAAAVTALSGVADELWGLRGQLIGIVAGDEQALRAVAGEAERADFPLLADSGDGVARAYGAYDITAAAVRPYVVIVDRSGKIVWTADGAQAAVAPAAIVAGLKGIAR
jgi:thioredoxin-dependent peroxiredoxin